MLTTRMAFTSTMFAAAAALACITAPPAAEAAALYSNGFETDIAGWDAFGGSYDASRVASGTNGITSASGSFHAESSADGSAGNWGGYNYGAGGGVPTVFQEYTTSADIYLDVGGGWANDTRFDFDSAISDNNGDFLQDFIFNAGFYNDATGPGAGTNRFVISTGNNSQPGSAYAKNPGHDPIAVSTTGWYTFQHHFYDNGGLLYVDMSIYDASNTLVNDWTLGGTHAIGDVGGNRYGWFDYNKFSTLAFDNTELSLPDAGSDVPEPSTLALLGLGLAGLAMRRKRHTV